MTDYRILKIRGEPMTHIYRYIMRLLHRTGRWISTSVQDKDPHIATLALIISIGALIVSSLEYRAVRTHNRLSVKPHVVITFYLEGGGDERNGIYLANPGLGPAIMKALSVEVGGKSYDAMDKQVWKNIFRDLTIIPGCFRQGWAQAGSALKAGEELALLTITHAKPPIVDGHSCPIELLKFLKTEGLKVRMQYESMYGEPHEAIRESWIDSDTISDITTVMMQHLAPKLAEQLQSMQAQLTQTVGKMQQALADMEKRTAEGWGLMLLHELHEDPPGPPRGQFPSATGR
jgi:hypothetical protein